MLRASGFRLAELEPQRTYLGAVPRFQVGYLRGFPKIRGTFLGVPIMRTIVYWVLYWGPLFGESTMR